VPREEADRAEFEALKKKVVKYNDTLFLMVDSEMITSEYLTREFAEAVGDALKEQGVYTGNKTGNALASYVLSYYGPKVRDIERFLEISEAQKKKSSP